MTLPRIDILINSGRLLSLQRDYGDSHGIDQAFFVEAINKGLLAAQQGIVNSLSETFSQYKEYTITAQTEVLVLPSDIFIDDLVYEVRYSSTGLRTGLQDPLELAYVRGRGFTGTPENYIVQQGQIYLNPEPVTGLIEIRYEGCLPKAGLRKGTIESFTGTFPELLTVTFADDEYFSADDWEILPEYLSCVSWDGTVTMKAIQVQSIDTGTRVVTIRSAFEADSDETFTVGDFICFGTNTSTHIKLPRVGELFMLQFIQDEVNDLLSSDDQPISLAKQESYLRQLIDTYETLPVGPSRVANINRDGF